MQGLCKWFNTEKGYGFIAPDRGGKDVFIHISQLTKSGIKSLAEGQRVEFDEQQGKKGIEAINVRVI